MTDATQGDGYAVSSLDAMGEGYGFRKIRRELGVTAFGMNALVLPPGYASGLHFHEEQEETYFVHRAGSSSASATAPPMWSSAAGWPGSTPPPTGGMRNVGQNDAIVLVAGGKDGYVGRDGQAVDEDPHGGPPGA